MPRLLALAVSLAVAIPAYATPMRPRAGAYELQVLVDGRPVRSFAQRGETWLLGQLGERYTLRVVNRSSRPIEAVVSVDGRDVIDGDTASPQKGGYLVPAYGTVDIDGWRISHDQAAAFRFSRVVNSYAAQMGSGREVGVIGVAVFEQRIPPPPPPVAVVPREEPQRWPESCCAGEGHGASGSNGYNHPKDSNKAASLDDAAPAQAPSAPTARMAPPPATAAPMPAAPGKSEARDEVADGYGLKGPAGSGDDRGIGGLGSRGGGDYEGARAQEAERKKEKRAGLGTEYGETVSSYIREVPFERASSRPAVVLGARYNDREGLIALGIDVDGMSEQVLRRTAEPFPVVERSFAQPPPNWRR